MKNNSEGSSNKRINRLEKKLYRYTEIISDVYTRMIKFEKILGGVERTMKSMEKEIKVIEGALKKCTAQKSARI